MKQYDISGMTEPSAKMMNSDLVQPDFGFYIVPVMFAGAIKALRIIFRRVSGNGVGHVGKYWNITTMGISIHKQFD